MLSHAKRTCYLHIGTPKAGSTTIQGFLHTQKDALKAAGVDLPTFGTPDIFAGGIALANAFENGEDLDDPKRPSWRWLADYLATTDGDLCISRETFCRNFAEKDKLQSMHGFFAKHNVRLKMIAYVRDTTGLLNAKYTQNAKRFIVNVTFDQWVEGLIKNPPVIATNMKMFKHLLKSGDVELAVRPLPSLGPQGLIGDFVAQLGRSDFDWSGYDEKPFRNQTPGARTIAASLVAGRAVEAAVASGKLTHLDKWREHGRQFRALAATRGWQEQPFYGPSAAMTERIEQRFAEQNERFAQRAWQRSWTEAVPISSKPQSVYDFDAAPAHERAEITDLAGEFVDGLIAATPQRRKAMKRLGGVKQGRVSADFPGD